MKLEMIGSTRVRTSTPTETEIVKAVGDACAGAIDAVVLDDDSGHGFMQTMPGGRVECCVTPSGGLFGSDAISPAVTRDLFLSFARGDDQWRTMIKWSADVAGKAPPQGAPQGRSVTGSWEREWKRARETFRFRDLDDYKKTTLAYRAKLESKPQIERHEWETLRRTANIVRGAAAREAATAETIRESVSVADEVEELYWHQVLTRLSKEPMDTAFSKRKIAKELGEVVAFLTDCPSPPAALQSSLAQTRETLAWTRARKKLSEAATALSAGRGDRLRLEAAVALREDWPAIFPTESIPALP